MCKTQKKKPSASSQNKNFLDSTLPKLLAVKRQPQELPLDYDSETSESEDTGEKKCKKPRKSDYGGLPAFVEPIPKINSRKSTVTSKMKKARKKPPIPSTHILREKDESFMSYIQRAYKKMQTLPELKKIAISTPYNDQEINIILFGNGPVVPQINGCPFGPSYEFLIRELRKSMKTDDDIIDALFDYDSAKEKFSNPDAIVAAAQLFVLVNFIEPWRKQGAKEIFDAYLLLCKDKESGVKFNINDLRKYYKFADAFGAEKGRKQVVRLKAVNLGLISEGFLNVYFNDDYKVYRKMKERYSGLIRFDSEPDLNKTLKTTFRLFSIITAFEGVHYEVLMQELGKGFKAETFKSILKEKIKNNPTITSILNNVCNPVEIPSILELENIFEAVLKDIFREEPSESENPFTIRAICNSTLLSSDLTKALSEAFNDICEKKIDIAFINDAIESALLTLCEKPDVSKKGSGVKQKKKGRF
ncbi:MAG: hypothetical protein J5802_08025 [Butyrivibrio sp.]|nr:hypothetical protein [Butyrivibrio sp.]